MIITTVEIFKILLAVLVGSSIGLERELHHKAAGFRTITLICIGATLISMLDTRLAYSGRLVANVVTGIGFLGAGVILHDISRIKGLTTAASVWTAAAIGIGIGSGDYWISIIVTGVVLVVMVLFARLERRIDRLWDMRHYQIVLDCDPAKVEWLDALLRGSSLRVGVCQHMKVAGQFLCSWDVSGTMDKQNAFVQAIIADPEVKEVKW